MPVTSRRAGKQDGQRYERIDHTNKKIVLSERDLKFLVNPYDFVDTGLFSDHRDTRQMVREMAAGKDFLNLYCYTAAFSCYAAALTDPLKRKMLSFKGPLLHALIVSFYPDAGKYI